MTTKGDRERCGYQWEGKRGMAADPPDVMVSHVCVLDPKPHETHRCFCYKTTPNNEKREEDNGQ